MTDARTPPIMIRPRARPRPQPEAVAEPAGPSLRGRAKHFAQMDATAAKPRPLPRWARKLAKLVAPNVGAELMAGRRRRKG